MIRVASCITAAILLASSLAVTAQSGDAEKVWVLEKAYWKYVQAGDLKSYRSLWRADFLGWPAMSAEPLRKDHITDWITAAQSRGEALKSYELERLSIQVSGNLATTTYRAHQRWVDKSGAEHPSVLRIIHTWVRDTSGSWQILSGMSAPPNADVH